MLDTAINVAVCLIALAIGVILLVLVPALLTARRRWLEQAIQLDEQHPQLEGTEPKQQLEIQHLEIQVRHLDKALTYYLAQHEVQEKVRVRGAALIRESTLSWNAIYYEEEVAIPDEIPEFIAHLPHIQA